MQQMITFESQRTTKMLIVCAESSVEVIPLWEIISNIFINNGGTIDNQEQGS